jgi:RNA polymerase sigma-70 factor, ECF subfamily
VVVLNAVRFIASHWCHALSESSKLVAARAVVEPRGGDDNVDQALVARWLGGDERAATLIVERHAQALARFGASLLRGDGRGQVDELVQDTFVRAFQSLADFRGESSLRTWLFTIERRLFLDLRRAERRRPDADEIGEGDAATEFTALDTVVAGETEGQIRAAIEGLSPLQREVFLLRVTEGMSYKEIAGVLGTTEGAARVHYHNAVNAIKEQVDG